MNAKTATIVIALAIALIASALPAPAEAAPLTGSTGARTIASVALPEPVVIDEPVMIGSASSTGEKSLIAPVFSAPERKVKHTDGPAVVEVPAPSITVFEDGSWLNNDTGENGCYAGDICND